MGDDINLLPDQISYDRTKILGSGGFGTVFLGSYNGKQVAVKRIESHRLDPKDREVALQKQLNHENVMEILAVEHDVDFRYIVLELCAGTLKNVCEGEYAGPSLPADVQVVQQIIEGLHYIHSKNLVHRDVKPENILVSKSAPATIKLSDFGLSKETSSNGTYSISAIKGTLDWMAPELKLNNAATEMKKGSSSIDIFSTGCVIFYYVTRGKHPFGEPETVTHNIVQNKPVNIDKAGGCPQFLIGIVREMIECDPNKRPPSENVLKKFKWPFLTGEFQNVVRSVADDGHCVIRFHPTEPVVACIVADKMIVFHAAHSCIPFSHWDATTTIEFPCGNIDRIVTMEWNVDGTRLAAIASNERDVIVWSYPSGAILFQKNLPEQMKQIVWNPYRPSLLATFKRWWDPFREDIAEKSRGVWLRSFQYSVIFCDSSPADRRAFHLCTFKRETSGVIVSVQWISGNRAALGLYNGGIEICEIDESTATAQVVKSVGYKTVGWIRGMLWDERTKCLATCSYRWTKVWSMDSDQPMHNYKDGFCRSFAWLPNGTKTDGEGLNVARNSPNNFILASGMGDGGIIIWTPLGNEKRQRILRKHSGVVDTLSFSPDGRFLASADTDGELIIWSTENWDPVFIGEKDGWVDSPSWMSTLSTDVPEYKLTFNSSNGTVRVVEYRRPNGNSNL